MENKHKYFYNVDFLRFLLAITIVIYHCSTRNYLYKFFPNVEWLSSFYKNASDANLSVDMFFIISGFFLFYTFKEIDVFEFIKNRLIRLYPLILFYSMLTIFMSIYVFEIPNYLPYKEFYRLLLIDNIGFSLKSVGLTWFVSVSFWISLFYFYSYKHLNRKFFNFLNALLVLFCFVFFIHSFNGRLGAAHYCVSYYNIFNVGVMRGIAGIGTGYFMFLLYNSLSVYNNTKFKSIISTILECSLIYFVFNHLVFQRLHYSNLIVIIAFCTLFILFTLQNGLLSTLLNNNFSKLLGKYSYSIFMVHIFVLQVFDVYIFKTHPSVIISYGYWNIVSIVLCSIIVAVLVHHLFEVPIAKKLKQLKAQSPMGGG